MLGKWENIDRRIQNPELEPVDVLMLTLDADTYLEKCLDSVYREIPVNKLIVIDGGSKDKTLELIAAYPRTEAHLRPDVRTTGKCYEIGFSLATTEWLAMIDADVELPPGWYDEMARYKSRYDFFECKRIMHYEFYREVPKTVDINARPLSGAQLAKVEYLKNYHLDDDYNWRAVDIHARYVVEKNGGRYGKVHTPFHYHHTTDKLRFESDASKKGVRMVFRSPQIQILDKANWEKRSRELLMAVVKYTDPVAPYIINDVLLNQMRKLDKNWIKRTNPLWHKELMEFKRKRYVFYRLTRLKKCSINLASNLYHCFKDFLRDLKQ
ncbi:glycosyltransferase family 2 protein [Candidatus Sumerlaeota bacterium]|nr:glycosyltransferase family 2 protein [Candidatus Sumerlaeota bacterium]